MQTHIKVLALYIPERNRLISAACLGGIIAAGE